MKKFRVTRDGINGVQEVKFQPIPGKSGYVGGGFWAGESKYRIHLDTATMVGSTQTYCVEVYLHEATHKYARTEDHSYLLPNFMHLPQPYVVDNLRTRQAIENADSFAGFAKEVWYRANLANNAAAVATPAVAVPAVAVPAVAAPAAVVPLASGATPR